ncbi:MAG: hypothetical protein AB8B69_12550, partial [Chitinophagales bacterium]
MRNNYSNTLVLNFLLAFISTLWTPLLQAQINVQNIATDLNVCGESNALTYSLTPEQEIQGIIDLQITLSEGIEYLDNSLLILESPNNISLSIINVPETFQIQLQVNTNGTTWAIGETLSFEIQRTANCSAIDFAQIGGTFEDQISISQGGTNIANQDANYGIQFASLSIFQPGIVSGDSGQKIFRDITINNGGFACTDDITYFVVLEQGLTMEKIRFGTYSFPLTFSGDTVFVSLNEILLGVGNGDTCFDDGESIVLKEELRMYSCQTLLIETEHNIRWGCNGNACNPFEGTTGDVVIIGGTEEPNIRIVPLQYNVPGTCTNGQGEFLVINDGTPNENDPGYIINPLINLEWDFSFPDSGCSKAAGIITNPIINGIPYDKGGYNSGKYAINLAANKNTEMGLVDADGDGFYDDLLPGDTIHVQYQIDFDCSEACFCDIGVLTDISSVLYNDFCGASVYQQAVESDFTIERSYEIPQSDFPTNLKIGEIGTLNVCSDIDQNLNCSSDQSTLLVSVSDSLVLSPNLPNAYLTDGTPLTAILLADGMIEVAGIEGISVNCINLDFIWNGQVNPENYSLSFDILYECETGCDCFEGTSCGSFSKTPTLDALTGECVSVLNSGASAIRQTYGWTDFDLQETVNPNEDALNLLMALACDTISYQSETFVESSVEDYNDIRLRLLYSNSDEGLPLLEWLYGTIRWYDSETENYFDCPITEAFAEIEPTEDAVLNGIDFAVNDFFENCGLNGNDFSQGDSLFLQIDFIVVEGNLSSDVVVNPSFILQFYAEDITNDEEVVLSCQSANANIQLYQNKTMLPDTSYVVASCNTQTLGIEWGNDIEELINGPNFTDFFPNEIRPTFRFDSVKLKFPKELQYIENSARMNYLPNPVEDYFLQPSKIEEQGEQIEYTFVNDGDWPIGDRISYLADTTGNETIGGYFQLSFEADCTGANEVEATFFIENNYHSTEPECRNHLVLNQTYPLTYSKPQISASVLTPNIDGLAGQVSAQLEFCNNSGELNMPNAFLLFETENDGDITVLSSNIGTLSTLEDGLQILQLGNILPVQCLDIELQLAYSNCAESSILKTFYSWDCVDYPNNIEEMKCSKVLRSVTINPKESEIQLDVKTPDGVVELCDTMFYEFTINSAQLANITQPILVLDLPPLQGLILTDATTIEYPLGTLPRSFSAVIEGNQLVIDLGLADAANEPIGGIADLGINGFALSNDANERKANIRLGFVTDCNFVAGSSIRASVFANVPCGAPALGSGFSQILPPVSIQDIDDAYQTNLQIAAMPL